MKSFYFELKNVYKWVQFPEMMGYIPHINNSGEIIKYAGKKYKNKEERRGRKQGREKEGKKEEKKTEGKEGRDRGREGPKEGTRDKEKMENFWPNF